MSRGVFVFARQAARYSAEVIFRLSKQAKRVGILMPDTGGTVADAGCRMQDAGYRILDVHGKYEK